MSETQRVVHKRKRTALSCYRCRSRKVKCGRELPSCLRCVKGGFADSCNYDARSAHSSKFGTRSVQENTEASNEGDGHQHGDGFSPSGQPPARQSEYYVDGASEPVPGEKLPPQSSYAHRSREDELYELKGRVDTMLQSVIRGPSNSHVSRNESRYPLNISGWSRGEPASSVEGIFFRGKAFKTQYYGPSHLFSFVGEVCLLRMIGSHLAKTSFSFPIFRCL